MTKQLFHSLIRWGLGIHGAIHVVETAVNIYEHAWISASISAFVAFLMLAGALIDLSHHHEE